MQIEILDAAAVRSRLSMSACIEAMATAMTAMSNGQICAAPRVIMPLIDRSGFLGVMSGSASTALLYGAKVVSLHPGNVAAGRPLIQGYVILFDHRTGTPLALVDGAEITAIRTAAASALATRQLARPESTTLGLIGYGVQASTHLEAICAVRGIDEVRVWGRDYKKAQDFAARHAPADAAIDVHAVADVRQAAECDIVCVVTGASEPVILGEWLRPGSHVNLVGAHSPTTREADTALIVRGRIYVDSLASAWAEAGDLLLPIAEGAIDRSHIVGELGQLLQAQVSGRRTASDITVYKSLGHVAQDLLAAQVALDSKVKQ